MIKTELSTTDRDSAEKSNRMASMPRIMALLDQLFMPNYLLTASQAIVIGPGESPQPWHTDDSFYPIPRPRPMISLSTIVAVEDFTADNGGTEVIPGSHLWDDEKVAGTHGDEEAIGPGCGAVVVDDVGRTDHDVFEIKTGLVVVVIAAVAGGRRRRRRRGRRRGAVVGIGSDVGR